MTEWRCFFLNWTCVKGPPLSLSTAGQRHQVLLQSVSRVSAVVNTAPRSRPSTSDERLRNKRSAHFYAIFNIIKIPERWDVLSDSRGEDTVSAVEIKPYRLWDKSHFQQHSGSRTSKAEDWHHDSERSGQTRSLEVILLSWICFKSRAWTHCHGYRFNIFCRINRKCSESSSSSSTGPQEARDSEESNVGQKMDFSLLPVNNRV